MSVGINLINFDTLFNNTVNTEKFIINDLDVFNNDNKKIIDTYMMKNYTDDNISIIPSCSCGNLKGTYYIGETCEECQTTVKNSLEDSVSFLLWARRPEGINKFISPIVLGILLDRYKITRPSIPIIKWLMLPNYKFDRRQQKTNMVILDRIETILGNYGIKRGYNSFIDNIVPIVATLERELIKGKNNTNEVVEFIEKHKDLYLSDYLPFPNRVIFTTESNEMGKFVDKNIIPCINVVRRLTGIDLHYKPNSVKQVRVANAVLELANFYKIYMRDTFFIKEGLIRQHISSTRSHFTARAVATSISGPHAYDEVHLPWSVGCSLLRVHILNKLDKLGYTYKDAINFLTNHTRAYSPLLDNIFKEIISESGTGLYNFLNRNPSLHRGSIILTRITKIKPDVNDCTIGVSLMIVRLLNADFDGDELNNSLVYSSVVAQSACNFMPHHNLLGFDDVNSFTNCIGLPKTIIATFSNWFRDGTT